MFSKLLQTLRCALPATCIVCQQASGRDYSLCEDCELTLPKLGECCQRCGVELKGRLSYESLCSSCLLSAPTFDTCRAAFPYASPINKLVGNFKFSARFDIGYSLSRVLSRAFNAHYSGTGKPQLLLPVPLHTKRLRARGFNQSNEICRMLSSHCGVTTAYSVLKKIRSTKAQTSMNSADARKSNLRGAFALSPAEALKDISHIALVDDVVTTMATSEAISRLIRAQQDCQIDVWCLARASRQG